MIIKQLLQLAQVHSCEEIVAMQKAGSVGELFFPGEEK